MRNAMKKNPIDFPEFPMYFLMWYNPFKPRIFDGQSLKLLPQLYHFKMII